MPKLKETHRLTPPKVLAKRQGNTAIKVLVGIMSGSGSDSDKLKACQMLLDRGYGKATEHVEVNATLDITAQFSDFLRSLDKPNDNNVIDVTPEHSAPMLQRSNNTDNDDDPDDDAN